MSKIEFVNGSTITTVESDSGNIRSKVKGYMNCDFTEVVVCNSDGCLNNRYGSCKLSSVKVRDGECENFEEEEENDLYE